MSRAWVWLLASTVAFSVGCSEGKKHKKEAPKRAAGEASFGMHGVDPSIFKCDTVAPIGAISQAVGGEVVPMEPMFTPPAGTPPPCDFRQLNVEEVEVPDGAPAPAQRMWSIRFDCRESFLPTTKQELERLVGQENATRVDVGQGGVEHQDAALVFLDDDAPCSVRIVGPGSAERQAIARAIAARLTPKTAPMTPRPAQ